MKDTPVPKSSSLVSKAKSCTKDRQRAEAQNHERYESGVRGVLRQEGGRIANQGQGEHLIWAWET